MTTAQLKSRENNMNSKKVSKYQAVEGVRLSNFSLRITLEVTDEYENCLLSPLLLASQQI